MRTCQLTVNIMFNVVWVYSCLGLDGHVAVTMILIWKLYNIYGRKNRKDYYCNLTNNRSAIYIYSLLLFTEREEYIRVDNRPYHQARGLKMHQAKCRKPTYKRVAGRASTNLQPCKTELRLLMDAAGPL